MFALENDLNLYILATIQVVGLLSGLVARLGIGSRSETTTQIAFFACLTLVGGTTILAAGIAPHCWMLPGITFALMVLTVVCDFGGSRRVTVHWAGPDR